ncbi:MAG: hypothetical protein HY356_01440 [Gammaproteobacteria bacterium]|nr:hypothetical protein [Gammaproteobacteria bacterium]
MTENLLSIPTNAGRAIIEMGTVIACPLLGTDRFVQFCNDLGLSINRERLLRLERLKLFAPVFRVLTPVEDVPSFSIPLREGINWFEKGWAWDTTGVESTYQVPDQQDQTQEGYYSIFQLDYLQIVLASLTFNVQMDNYLDRTSTEDINWNKNGKRWLQLFLKHAESLRTHEYRRSKGLLCQFISNRYYPQTQGDKRTIQVPFSSPHYSDQWISVYASDWDWYKVAQDWDPCVIERLFQLTPEKLRHAYEGMAITQAHYDPLERWYQLTQFVSVHERKNLKKDALLAETLRSGAYMLRLLYKDLYKEELPHLNEVAGTIITHFPELEVRKDTRRYLEFVVNRFGLNPQPKVTLIVEGASEEIAIKKIFEEYFGTHHGKYWVEIIVLGGVDAATGTKEDRFRAIIRLIDYLHYHQTITFLILDNERYAKRLKEKAKRARSIHHNWRYVTRPEYIKIWRSSFEFENFSCVEIATALNEMVPANIRFSRKEISSCKRSPNPGACLKDLYYRKASENIKKTKLSEILVKHMLLATQRRKIEGRPIIKVLERIVRLATRNPFPMRQEDWERNQASKYLGKISQAQTHSCKTSRAGPAPRRRGARRETYQSR